jgi:hypothetical protein
VQSLTLLNTDIRTDGGAAIGTLCGGGHDTPRSCSKLQIERSRISEGGAVAMAQGLRSGAIGGQQLVDVRIMSSVLGSEGSPGATAVAASLGLCRELRTLFLVDAGLKDAGAVAFAAGLSEAASIASASASAAATRELSSGSNGGGGGSGGLGSLETLLLHSNGIGDRGT